MKKQSLLFLGVLLSSLSAFATDLIVREEGLGGSYGTISEAIEAAEDGDRIFIENKSGEIPYVEDLLVDKSLQFLPAQNGGQFHVIGDLTFKMTDGETSFIGLHLDGDINTTDTASQEVTVKILNCNVQSIELTNKYTLQLAQSTTYGVSIFNGNITGCRISNEIKFTSTDFPYSSRKSFIVGNYIIGKLVLSSQNQFIIKNNHIRTAVQAIQLFPKGDLSNQEHQIMNNLCENTYTSVSSNYIIAIYSIPEVNKVKIYNNILYTRNSYRGISCENGDVSYNLFHSRIGTTVNSSATVKVGNISGKVFGVDTESHIITTEDNVDLGHPSYNYYDLDLTRNDMGVFGGSYSWNNYYSDDNGDRARVIHIDMPQRVSVGGTIDIQAEAFDK